MRQFGGFSAPWSPLGSVAVITQLRLWSEKRNVPPVPWGHNWGYFLCVIR